MPITEGTYAHWLMVAEKAERPVRRAPTPRRIETWRKEVLGFLISADWLKGEAAVLQVHVSAGEVKRRFDRIRGQQFPRRREFERFLRSSGQTVADLLLRVEQDLLSTRIERQIVAGHRTAAEREHVFIAWVKLFRVRWRAQTYCAPEYTVDDCGHIQATL